MVRNIGLAVNQMSTSLILMLKLACEIFPLVAVYSLSLLPYSWKLHAVPMPPQPTPAHSANVESRCHGYGEACQGPWELPEWLCRRLAAGFLPLWGSGVPAVIDVWAQVPQVLCEGMKGQWEIS